MAWFKKTRGLKAEKKAKVPEGLWVSVKAARKSYIRKK